MENFSFNPIKVLENGVKLYSPESGDVKVLLINKQGVIEKYSTIFHELPLNYKLKLLNSIDKGYIEIKEKDGIHLKLKIIDEEKDALTFYQLMKNCKYVPIWQIPVHHIDDKCQSFCGIILKIPEDIGKNGEIFLIGFSPIESKPIIQKISLDEAKEILNKYSLIQEDEEELWINELISIIEKTATK